MPDSPRPPFGGQDVAVFIDFENIYISVLAEYDVNPDFESIMEKAGEFGRVSVAQAYADWTPYSHYINALHAHEIDPIYVPAYHYGEGGKQKGGAIKNSVDMFLCINAMKMLYSHSNIQTFVLLTGDRDFVPLVKTIREFGKRAVVIGVAGASSSHLAQAADEFFFYHQITDNLKPPEKEKPKTRDPYDTLVEAVKLARQRGYVATLASLKLLMSELMEDFDSARYKDPRGRSLAKFRDFVKEAERRGKVKLFTTGSINEVFLPSEDPKKTSRFVEEVVTPPEPEPDETGEAVEGEEEAKVEVEISEEQWKLFANAMTSVEGAVPFVRVFDVLRGLRNQGLLDLSNKELKGMVIKAIHMGLLTRSNRGRGRRTFYQLTTDPAVLGRYVELSAAALESMATAAEVRAGITPPAETVPAELPDAAAEVGEALAQSVEMRFADLPGAVGTPAGAPSGEAPAEGAEGFGLPPRADQAEPFEWSPAKAEEGSGDGPAESATAELRHELTEEPAAAEPGIGGGQYVTFEMPNGSLAPAQSPAPEPAGSEAPAAAPTPDTDPANA